MNRAVARLRSRGWYLLCSASLALVWAPSAHAALCGMMPNYQEGADIDIAMGRVSLPPSVAVGEVFYRQAFPIPGNLYAIVSCTPGDTTTWRVMHGTATSFSNVYTTSIAGVGMRTSWIPAGAKTAYFAGEKTTWRLGMAGTSGSVAQKTVMVSVTGSVVVELIKTAATVGSGALKGGTYTSNAAAMSYPFNSGVFISTRVSGGGSEIVPETGTCSIGDTLVNLPDVPFGRFHGIGSTTGETQFPIAFTCSGTNGAVTLTLAADTLGVDASLGLVKPQVGDLSASCVALQLLDGDTRLPVVLGKSNVVGKVINGAGQFNLPYRVRYYQSDAGAKCVSPGTVRGTATVTVSYQ